ncbi:MAG TPA: hypothetical protein PKK10_18960, partial [Woeseiaceae bacterium]|nr:hypothetical protein [Woeseiaceae bacterium]
TKTHRELVEFTAKLIAFRRANPVLKLPRFYTEKELLWFDADGQLANWHDSMPGLGCAILTDHGTASLCLLFNPSESPLRYQLPDTLQARSWQVAIDTSMTLSPRRSDRSNPLTALVSRSLRVLVEDIEA